MAQPKLRQMEIAGAERPRIEAVEEPIREYVEIMYARMAMQKKENEAYNAMHEALEEHAPNGYIYVDGEFEFEIKRKSKVKFRVKRKKLADDGDEKDDVVESGTGR